VINGAIPPLAASFGLSAPVNTTMNALVQAIERGGNAPLPRARET
jgi:ketopantoate reductase